MSVVMKSLSKALRAYPVALRALPLSEVLPNWLWFIGSGSLSENPASISLAFES